MNIEKILSEVPEGATHYGAKYLRVSDYGEWEYWYAGHWDYINQPSGIVRSLDDLREIQKLRAENEALRKWIAGISCDVQGSYYPIPQWIKGSARRLLESQAARGE